MVQMPGQTVSTTSNPASGAPVWPAANGQRAVFLLDASSRLEQRLLEQWIASVRPDAVAPEEVDAISPSSSNRN